MDYNKEYLNLFQNLRLRMRTISNWYAFVFPFTLLTKNRLVRLRNGNRILIRDIRSTDWGVLMDVAGLDHYNIKSINDPKIIVDAGAHIGVFAVLVATKFPSAKVFAVEPEINNYKQLLKNIELNHLTNVVPLNVALSTEYGEANLFISSSLDSHSISHADHVVGSQTVKTVPLSHFGKIDALKMDIENKEFDVIEKEVPICQYFAVEIHPQPLNNALVEKVLKQYSEVRQNKNVFVFTK